MNSLKGKVIIVTGGAKGIGQGISESLALESAMVAIVGRNESDIQRCIEKIQATGGQAFSFVADLSNPSECHQVVEKVATMFGKIDGLVNAAGGNMPDAVVQPDQDVFQLNFQALQDVMQLNLMGTVMPTQVFGKAIKKNGSGSIVNISSVVSQLAITKVLGYSMAKSAIDSYTQWFALELANRFGDAIRMNSIAPGFFLTEQNKTLLTNTDGSLTERGQLVIQNTPFKRFGNPEELVGALIWLLSDASKYVTGSKITVDGGFTVFGGV